MKKGTFIFLVALAAAMPARTATAAAEITFSGRLYSGTNETSVVAETGNQTLEFRLYRGESDAVSSALWGRGMMVKVEEGGTFKTALSDVLGTRLGGCKFVSLRDAVREAGATGVLYVGVASKKAGGEYAPRQKVMCVPFAAYALDTDYSLTAFMAEGKFSVAKKTTVGGDLRSTNGGLILNNAKADFPDGMALGGGITLSNGTLKVTAPSQFSGVGMAVPGQIVMWNSTTPPAGWVICDGTKGTPDLRGQFIVGAGGEYKPHAFGGADKVALKAEHIPPHTHEYIDYGELGNEKNRNRRSSDLHTYAIESDDADSWTGENAGGVAHENRPPYYVLTYIMFVGR